MIYVFILLIIILLLFINVKVIIGDKIYVVVGVFKIKIKINKNKKLVDIYYKIYDFLYKKNYISRLLRRSILDIDVIIGYDDFNYLTNVYSYTLLSELKLLMGTFFMSVNKESYNIVYFSGNFFYYNCIINFKVGDIIIALIDYITFKGE